METVFLFLFFSLAKNPKQSCPTPVLHLDSLMPENPLPVGDPVPVGLPDVDGLGVGDAVLQRLVVQQVEEVLDGQRDGPAGAEDGGEQVVHELLQRSLRQSERTWSMSRLARHQRKGHGGRSRAAQTLCWMLCVCGTFMESSRVR